MERPPSDVGTSRRAGLVGRDDEFDFIMLSVKC